jgi:hypothetical protein
MKYFFGILLIAMGLFHGIHVLGIEAGSVTNLNGSRFLSFAALDRFASTGILGKMIVLMIDVTVFFGGVYELTRKKNSKSKDKKLQNK